MYTTSIKDVETFKKRLLFWAEQFEHCCVLDSQSDDSLIETDKQSLKYDMVVAAGIDKQIDVDKDVDSFDKLKSFCSINNDWVFGYFSYDLKNEVEDLSSNNKDEIKFPIMHFFSPLVVMYVIGDKLTVCKNKKIKGEADFSKMLSEIDNSSILVDDHLSKCSISSRFSKKEYLDTVFKIKEHIRYGDIYEMNFCQEFFAEDVMINPLSLYVHLTGFSANPFSCYYKNENRHLICGSPERFLKKEGTSLMSQPIKGTKARGINPDLDSLMKKELLGSVKEKSENVMIVDLVRNDLSKTAKVGTVKVNELFGVHTFKQMHQMISTISSELKDDVHFIDAIKECFPMGSMTGAPKIRAMELIEKYEKTKRGIYSGAIGYIDPKGDFDFNVVIRSIAYDQESKYLSFIVGGAITDKSIPLDEYEECLLKAKPIFMALGK